MHPLRDGAWSIDLQPLSDLLVACGQFVPGGSVPACLAQLGHARATKAAQPSDGGPVPGSNPASRAGVTYFGPYADPAPGSWRSPVATVPLANAQILPRRLPLVNPFAQQPHICRVEARVSRDDSG